MFPKFVWVGGHKYKLKFQRLDENDRGVCHTDKTEIIIDNFKASKTQILETIFHEIAHAVSEHFDMQPDDPNDKNYEHVISCCGKAMVLLMTQNQDLFQQCLLEIRKLSRVEEEPCCSKKRKIKKRKIK